MQTTKMEDTHYSFGMCNETDGCLMVLSDIKQRSR